MEIGLPNFFIEELKKQYGDEITEKISQEYNVKRKVTLRVNTIKATTQKIKNELQQNNINFSEVPWSKEALIINNALEKDIEELDIYKNGEIYLQSLSSMLPPIILNPGEGKDILDMAAAPGGKTTQMAALTNNKAHITACEMNNIRIEKLKHNIQKQGASCVYIMQKDSRNIDDFFSFDQILLDSPCSGSGTLNIENKNLEKYFTIKLVEKSVKSQMALLRKAIKILKPGGTMVYSTCSILAKENEDVLKTVISEDKAEIIPIEFEGKEEIPYLPVKISGTMCVCPTEYYEGFFVAKIRKNKSISKT